MLEISHRNGTYSNPLTGPRLVSTGCQTEILEPPPQPDKDSTFNKIMAVPKVASTSPISPKTLNDGQPRSNFSHNSSTSPDVTKVSLVMNGAIVNRPLSSASEESESSISEDDEISFNTIKRQVKPKSSAVNNSVMNSDGDGMKNGGEDNNNGHETTETQADNNVYNKKIETTAAIIVPTSS